MSANSLKEALLESGLGIEDMLSYVTWLDQVTSAPDADDVAPEPTIGREKRQLIERICEQHAAA